MIVITQMVPRSIYIITLFNNISMNQGLVQEYSYREQDPNYKGEPFDSTLADGPSQDRKCRDCFFLLIYIAFWAGLIAVAVIAFTNGQPHLLASPFDSTGISLLKNRSTMRLLFWIRELPIRLFQLAANVTIRMYQRMP